MGHRLKGQHSALGIQQERRDYRDALSSDLGGSGRGATAPLAMVAVNRKRYPENASRRSIGADGEKRREGGRGDTWSKHFAFSVVWDLAGEGEAVCGFEGG